MTNPVSALPALQRTLAGEHAAVYVYGVVGGRVSLARQPKLAAKVASGYTAHRGRRDQLEAMVRAAHGTPVAAEVSYVLPTPCRTPGELTGAARQVEQRSAGLYADLVANTSQARRQWAIDALTDAAVRQLVYAASPEPFPGAPELNRLTG